MCGLAGIFHPSGGPVDRGLLSRMTSVLAHRGPDGDGFHVEPGVGLGHRRLSIIDVAGGHQPMWNEDESVVIVFNGEIYNYASLWPKLQALGHVFRSDHSDTEAIIHAWESWGPDCLQHLNGRPAGQEAAVLHAADGRDAAVRVGDGGAAAGARAVAADLPGGGG